jgi:hypothetical protein
MRPPSEKACLFLWALFLLLAAFGLNQRHHHFPYYYHPDEPGKVEQILTGHWNFHHPMLLLTATNMAVDVFQVPREEQAIVETGRAISALFMALAVLALSLTAYVWRGWLAAIVAGLALLLHHQLYELSHYMKEDSALLMGLSFAFLFCVTYAQRGSAGRALLIGMACALAISGKYLGAVSLLIALPVLWIGSRGARLQRFALFTTGLVAVLLAVNFPLFWDIVSPQGGTFQKSLNREMDFVVKGQADVTRSVPHALYWNVFLDNTTPAIWLLLASFATAWSHRRSIRPIAERLIAAFPFALAIALSCSPKENDRYFLPATAIFTLLAAIGLPDLPHFFSRVASFFGAEHADRLFTERTRVAMIACAGALLLLLQFTGWSRSKAGWWRYDQAFTRDDIADLNAWMREKLPASSLVVADSRTGLRDPTKRKPKIMNPPPQRILVSRSAADRDIREKLIGRKFGPGNPEPSESILEQLWRLKVDCVVISEQTYGRYFRENLRAKDGSDPKYARTKAFYTELLRIGEPVFERDRGTVIYLHPGIRVYRLSPDG